MVPGATTVGQFLDCWLAAVGPTVRRSTLASYTDVLTGHVVPRIGNIKLAKVSPMALCELYAELLLSGRRVDVGGLSPRTVQYVHRILTHAFGDAVRWRRTAAHGEQPVLSDDVEKPPQLEELFEGSLREVLARDFDRVTDNVAAHQARGGISFTDDEAMAMANEEVRTFRAERRDASQVLVVLDTNIFLSALLTPNGLARRVVRAGIAGEFDYAACPKLLEMEGVAGRPSIAAAVADAQDFLTDVRSATQVEADPEIVPLSRDPNDDYLLALARVVSADHLVTGDADLLKLDDPPVTITSLRAFADLLEL